MSNRVIPFFVFGAGLLRFNNLGSFPQNGRRPMPVYVMRAPSPLAVATAAIPSPR
jgi:hypothetical protein